jgi:hypothetical protein
MFCERHKSHSTSVTLKRKQKQKFHPFILNLFSFTQQAKLKQKAARETVERS